MRTEVFREEHDVKLLDDEIAERARSCAFGGLAIEAQKERADEAAEAWKTQKKALVDEEKELAEALYALGRAVRDGKERRQVPCSEALVGVMVVTTRLDTGATVHTRAATADELRPKRDDKGGPKFTDEQIDAKLRASILRACAKPLAEGLLVKNAAKAHPERTPAQVKALVAAMVEEGALVEEGGKLLAVHAAYEEPSDDARDFTPPTH